mmetsp:Transcript_34879/g.84423  ORF Transcript_34879/g.84423 Transcript_34879/m.84423 type:complete len:84 (+) Transcript_34879:504-755(+)
MTQQCRTYRYIVLELSAKWLCSCDCYCGVGVASSPCEDDLLLIKFCCCSFSYSPAHHAKLCTAVQNPTRTRLERFAVTFELKR